MEVKSIVRISPSPSVKVTGLLPAWPDSEMVFKATSKPASVFVVDIVWSGTACTF